MFVCIIDDEGSVIILAWPLLFTWRFSLHQYFKIINLFDLLLVVFLLFITFTFSWTITSSRRVLYWFDSPLNVIYWMFVDLFYDYKFTSCIILVWFTTKCYILTACWSVLRLHILYIYFWRLPFNVFVL